MSESWYSVKEGYGEIGVEYEDITEKIIGCGYRVYNEMGFGYLESVYEKCMLIELGKAGLNVESQKPSL